MCQSVSLTLSRGTTHSRRRDEPREGPEGHQGADDQSVGSRCFMLKDWLMIQLIFPVFGVILNQTADCKPTYLMG